MIFARWTARVWALVAVIVVIVVIALVAVFIWPSIGGSNAAGNGSGSAGAQNPQSAQSPQPGQSVPTTGQGSASSPAGATTGDGTAQGSANGSADGSQPTVPIPTPQIVPMTPSDTAPSAKGIAAEMKKVLAEKLTYTATNGENTGKKESVAMSTAVANLAGIVIDPVTGKTLWKQKADEARLPASTMKVLTGAALLKWANPDDRLTTTVVKGDKPGQIVFVGGGDVTLSARPKGSPTVLPGGPTVSDLADQVKASGMKATSIVLDTSYWTGPRFAQGWDKNDITGTQAAHQGFVTNLSPLMVDADRVDAGNEDSPRHGNPAEVAGKALAKALGNKDMPLSKGKAPKDATVLAKVQSQPLSTLLAQALQHSDNVLIEALGRQAAIAMGAPPSFKGVELAVKQTLKELGIDATGLKIHDGSGMSADDRVPTKVLGELMAQAVSGKHPKERLLLPGLPLGGITGTLAQDKRYTQSLTKAGRGWVRAKTGSLQGVYALAGYVPDVDGRLLVFAFNSKGVAGNVNRYAQDALASGLRSCGCSG